MAYARTLNTYRFYWYMDGPDRAYSHHVDVVHSGAGRPSKERILKQAVKDHPELKPGDEKFLKVFTHCELLPPQRT